MAGQDTPPPMTPEALWSLVFSQGHPALQAMQEEFKKLPSAPRCKLCYAPFRGEGGARMRKEGREPSNRNPRYCSRCDQWIRENPGGADVEMTIVFLDVTGSTLL